MDFLSTLAVAIWIAAIGALVLLILAIVQEGRSGGRGVSIRQGFYAAVSLVLLTLSVTSLTFLLHLGLTSWALTNAPYGNVAPSKSTPPPLILAANMDASGAPVTSVRQCTPKVAADGTTTANCEFTSQDIQAFRSWVTEYTAWKAIPPVDTRSQAQRRDIVNALSFLIVAAPLFVVFYRLLRRRNPDAPLVVSSVYHYYVAFAGLVMTVVSAALLINVGLKAATGVKDVENNPSTMYATSPLVGPADTTALTLASVENCASACGFSPSEVAVAHSWRTDTQATAAPTKPTSKRQGDLASNLPLLAVGLPLFLFHFREARSAGSTESPAPRSTTSRRRTTKNRKK